MVNVIALLIVTFFSLTMLVNVEAQGLPIVGALDGVLTAAGTSLSNIISQVLNLVSTLLNLGPTLQVVLDTLVKVLQALLNSNLLK